MNNSIIQSQGIEATTFEETVNAANLNWEPQFDKVAGMDTGISMPRRRLVYRSDTREALGIVGEGYAATDPREFLSTQYEFADFIGGKVVRAGFIPDRSRAFAFVQLKDQLTLPKNLRAKGDPTGIYIYSTDGWDGGTPRRSRLYLERLVCSNGMSSREIKASLWVSHTKGSEARYEVGWKKFLAEIRTQIEVVRSHYVTLAQTRMEPAEAEAFLKKLIPGDSGMSVNRRQAIYNLFHKEESGNLGATRWDAFNAVTEFVSHERTYRETDNASQDVNRFLGVLETDTLRDQAMALLLN